MIEVPEAGPGDAAGSEAPHGFLRRATRPWHDGVEQAFERFDLATAEGLRGFLTRQAMALLPLERACEAAGVEDLLDDWSLRRRAALIAADLAHLGCMMPVAAPAPRFDRPSAMLGALYVLEGSKLGGRVLHRQVLASPDPRVSGAGTFLGHRHERGWPVFLAVLNQVGCGPDQRDGLLAGARIAFATFRAAAESNGALAFANAPTRFGLYHPAHV